MRLKRVGGNLGVIAPNFMQQGFARNCSGAGAIEKFQNIRFLFGQADFITRLRGQLLDRRPEFIRSKMQYGGITGFKLAQMRANARSNTPKRNGLAT